MRAEERKLSCRRRALFLALILLFGSLFSSISSLPTWAEQEEETTADDTEQETDSNIVTEEEFEEMLAAFPESYWDDLRAIHEAHPTWRFEAVDMGITWEEALAAESVLGVNLVSVSSVSSWKSTQSGAYDWDTGTWTGLDGSSWVAASEEIIAYYLDPRNYLNSTYIFAFLDYAYDEETQTLEGIQTMVAGTYLAGTYEEDGVTYSYPEILLQAARESGMSAYLIISTILVENGTQGTGASISGTVSGYEGYYNYFNIGAYATSSYTAVQRGLLFAAGLLTSPAATSYSRPWTTRYASILGGAQYYVENYIKAGQDTLYRKKFNIVNGKASHQYMTNIQAVSSEASKLSQAYTGELAELPLTFKIPVYQDMPETATTKPTTDGSPNNKLETLSVDGYSLTPTFDTDTSEYSLVVASGVTSVKITATAKDSTAKISGTGTVALTSGTNTVTITVTAENGDVRTYTLYIAVSDGKTSAGDVTIATDYLIVEDGSYIRGLSDQTSASSFLANFTITGGTAKLTLASSSSSYVGTGSVLSIYDEDGTLSAQYTVVLYGDVNGDGRITSTDLLKLQKKILGLTSLDTTALLAADANHDGKVNSTDLLKIQKSVLGIASLTQ